MSANGFGHCDISTIMPPKNILSSKTTFFFPIPTVATNALNDFGREPVSFCSFYSLVHLLPIIRCPVFGALAISHLWPHEMTLVQLFWKLCGSLNAKSSANEKGWHKLKLDSSFIFFRFCFFSLRVTFGKRSINNRKC